MISVRSLKFAYPDARRALFNGIGFEVPRGARVLLLGANGTGKSTLLRLIAGRHLLPAEMLRLAGRSPFHEAAAAVALVDGDYPVSVDLRVSELLRHAPVGRDERRERELIDLLEIDPAWRMCHVSDGQRRRVQILVALRRQVDVLLLDEVSANLDVIARSDFLRWVRRESESRGLTVVYATHVLDGLWRKSGDPWPTHLLFLDRHHRADFQAIGEIGELRVEATRDDPAPLLNLCERWIRDR